MRMIGERFLFGVALVLSAPMVAADSSAAFLFENFLKFLKKSVDTRNSPCYYNQALKRKAE